MIFRLLLALMLISAPSWGDAPTVKKIDASIQKTDRLTLEKIEFYYRADEQARYIELKNKAQAEKRGELTPERNMEVAREAFDASSVEKPFDVWRYHGGPNPNIFLIKAHVYNQTGQAQIDVPMTVSVRAKVGPLLVNPKTLLIDTQYLENTAKWMTLFQQQMTLPAIAQGEDMLFELRQFDLTEFLATHPGQWPTAITVSVSSSELDGEKTANLQMKPDHFVVPVLY